MTELLYGLGTALVSAVVAAVMVRVNKRKVVAETVEKEATAAQTIQSASMALIEPLNKRIDEMGRKIERQAAEIKELRKTLEAMEKTEEYLVAQLHDREKRIKHLEDVCKRAGINGDGADQ